LSGIDVSTQMLNQNFQEPFVAIVIDPVRTISAGKVCLGAFRTYPKVHIILLISFMIINYYKKKTYLYFMFEVISICDFEFLSFIMKNHSELCL